MLHMGNIISGKESLPGIGEWNEIENFLGTNWSLSYDLYNPENFEDPDTAPQWYDPKDCYTFYETPFCNGAVIEISGSHTPENISLLKYISEQTEAIESTIISFLVKYTFYDGGAYAAGKHFHYAKKTIETRENIHFEDEADFIKHCLCVGHIILVENGSDWTLWVRCAWNSEGGMEFHFHNEFLVSVE